jgi:hypothetical protein
MSATATNAIPTLCISDRQDLYSMAYVRAVVAAAGFGFSGSDPDRNSEDMGIEHLEVDGFVPNYQRIRVQVKCTYAHGISEDGYIHYPLLVRNYNHLRATQIEPRILVVVLVPKPEPPPIEPWIECIDRYTVFRYRAYWKSLMGAAPTDNDDNITVKVPIANSFDIDAVHYLMENMAAKGNKTL